MGLVVGLVLWAGPVLAQRAPGSAGVGLKVGRPGGFTAKLYRPAPIAYDVSVATDGDDYVSLYLHRLWERPLPQSPLHLYIGPGLLLGTTDLPTTPAPALGLSAKSGLNFYADRFEVFLHAQPTLTVTPDVDPALGWSVGLRYYL
jgi:hypothetical protein